ncbi:MAG: hypothetical protein E4G94_00735 [ANME-2 cluster archaeon]|nr:MAG: hypothetical protein E4G94_00735 [ANME-2 cluster archaeon]
MVKNKKLKFIIPAIGILFVLLISGYYLNQHALELGLTKPALVLKVSLSENDDNPMFNNVTFEQSQVMFFYKTTDKSAEFPEINAQARLNTLNAPPATYWAGSSYKGEGTYELRLYFLNGQEPEPGADILIIPIRVTDFRGTIMNKTTAFYMWE